jgi:hypothetical protein
MQRTQDRHFSCTHFEVVTACDEANFYLNSAVMSAQTYDYKQTKVIEGQIQYRRPDNAIELVVYFTERLICWRETAPQTGTGGYHCPYAAVSFE